MSRKLKGLVIASVSFMPLMAGAVAGNANNVLSFMNTLSKVMNAIVPITVALALIYFIYGLAEYILEGSGDTTKREEGRTRMIYGTIAMFVIASVWGLVYFMQDTLGIQRVDTINAPMVAPYNALQ